MNEEQKTINLTTMACRVAGFNLNLIDVHLILNLNEVAKKKGGKLDIATIEDVKAKLLSEYQMAEQDAKK